ncbi:DUF1924 domain-containing protein [Kaarinaea lacus]
MKNFLFSLAILFVSQATFAASELDDAFKKFAGSENLTFSADRGKELWNKKYPASADAKGWEGKERECSVCHTKDLTKKGKHVKTGKEIDPLAPSANPERFTELKKIEKWFKRNCKWTLDRECTNQEKGDLLKFLSSQ